MTDQATAPEQTTRNETFARLAAPFAPDRISWRVGSINTERTRGHALAYIDARDVMRRLDDVAGPADWQDRYEVHGTKTICYLSLRIDGEWITKADGAGDTDIEAEKGSISDAFKRAAVKWGVGRYLYDLESRWVDLEKNGRSSTIAPRALERLKADIVRQAGGPAPEAPAKAPEAEPDLSERVADTMIDAVRAMKSLRALVAWSNREDTIAALADLPQAQAERVEVEYYARKEGLEKAKQAA